MEVSRQLAGPLLLYKKKFWQVFEFNSVTFDPLLLDMNFRRPFSQLCHFGPSSPGQQYYLTFTFLLSFTFSFWDFSVYFYFCFQGFSVSVLFLFLFLLSLHLVTFNLNFMSSNAWYIIYRPYQNSHISDWHRTGYWPSVNYILQSSPKLACNIWFNILPFFSRKLDLYYFWSFLLTPTSIFWDFSLLFFT